MFHPFQTLINRRPLFIILLILTLVVMVLMNMIGAPLTTDQAPFGIISFELVGDVAGAQAIISSWDQNAQLHAALSLGFDYLFMLLYSTTIGLACVWAGDVLRTRRWPLSALGVPLAWGQWLAAILDAVENLALVIILFGTLMSPWPEIARICAILKFGLIFLGLVYAIFGFVASFLRPATQ